MKLHTLARRVRLAHEGRPGDMLCASMALDPRDQRLWARLQRALREVRGRGRIRVGARATG